MPAAQLMLETGPIRQYPASLYVAEPPGLSICMVWHASLLAHSSSHLFAGMRAVMAVLRAAGNLKTAQPDAPELELVLRAITDVNLCKFLSHDVPLFRAILADLFPGVPPPAPDHTNLEQAIGRRCTDAKLQATEYFVCKTIQLYEMVVVRHGLMVVGRPFSGKSSSLKVRSAAYQTLVRPPTACMYIAPAITVAMITGTVDVIPMAASVHLWFSAQLGPPVK